MQPQILLEDEALLIINKPAGVTVNNSETTHGVETVQDWAASILKIMQPSPAIKVNDADPYDPVSAFYSRGGIVHRLDKETSGILLIAKNPESFISLQAQFKERSVKKTYIALVHGILKPETGEINIPVGRLPWNRKQFGIVAGGRESVTFYETLTCYTDSEKKQYSLLRLFPKTGRTHQIRVHLKHIGHPIFADYLYAGRKQARDDRKRLDRVFLHAGGISFTHPVSHEIIELTAPLPHELDAFLDSLKKVA